MILPTFFSFDRSLKTKAISIIEDPSDHHERESHFGKFITQEDLHYTQNFDEEDKNRDTMGFLKTNLQYS